MKLSNMPRHKQFTKHFHELSFDEQAKSITATINNLQNAIFHHVEHSKKKTEVKNKCILQAYRFLGRLLERL